MDFVMLMKRRIGILLSLISVVIILAVYWLAMLKSDQFPRSEASHQIVYECAERESSNGVCRIDLQTLELSELVTRKNSSARRPYLHIGGLNLALTKSSEVLFRCENKREEPAFCLLHADNGELAVIDDPTESRQRFDLNSKGQVVYTCNPADGFHSRYSICLLNVRTGEFKVISPETHHAEGPSLNELGQVAFGCGPRIEEEFVVNQDVPPQICMVNVDGSGFEELTSSAHFALYPTLSNVGKAVFSCMTSEEYDQRIKDGDYLPTLKVCIANTVTKQVVVLNHEVTPFHREYKLSVNDHGEIVYACDGEAIATENTERRTICYVKTDGSGFHVLVPQAFREFAPVSIGNDRLIAFLCSQNRGASSSANSEICIMNSDGGGFMQLTDDDMLKGLPQIN